jgi:RNA-directed DNA polymerase
LIKPAKNSKLAVLRKIKGILNANKAAKQSTVIRLLNPVIRGWANYHSTVVSKATFAYCDYRIYQMLWKWARRRHPNKGAQWVRKRYFTQQGTRNGVFADGPWTLATMSDTRIIRHVKIQGQRSPHRPSDREYFETRRQQLLLKRLSDAQKSAVQKTHGRCVLCSHPISAEHFRRWQINRENPFLFVRMTRDMTDPLVVVHRWCYERYRSTSDQDTLPPKREPTPSLEALDGWVD